MSAFHDASKPGMSSALCSPSSPGVSVRDRTAMHHACTPIHLHLCIHMYVNTSTRTYMLQFLVDQRMTGWIDDKHDGITIRHALID